jgi:uncharacterized protein YkwD
VFIVSILMVSTAAAATPSASAGVRGRMLQRLNSVRRAHGEHPLRLCKKVSRDARRHSREMADRGYLFHTKNVPGLLDGRPWSAWGENVAKARSVGSTVRAWMRSSEHRVNILNAQFRRVGVGIFSKGKTLWSTTDFWG